MKIAILACILFMFGTVLLALTCYCTTTPVINDTVDPTLSIIAPNGGESWFIGDTRDITYGTNPDNWPAGWDSNSNNAVNVSCSWTADGYRLPSEAEKVEQHADAAFGGFSRIGILLYGSTGM